MGRKNKKKQQLLVEKKSEADLPSAEEKKDSESVEDAKKSNDGKKQAMDLFNKPPEEVKKTPQEKTDEYITQQRETHESFLNKFKKEEDIINQTPETNESA